MSGSILGKRPREFAHAIVINKPAKPSKPSKASISRSKSRAAIPVLDSGDFEAAVSGALETIREDDTTSSRKKQRTCRKPLSPTCENTRNTFSSPVKGSNSLDLENIPPIPQTPRHRDSVKKQPITPRHRITLTGKPTTPQSVPATPSRADNIPSVLGPARALFSRGTMPGKLIGREEERSALTNYLEGRIEAAQGGCLYISGPPGTGKSALLNEVLSDIDNNGSINKATINCMVIQEPKAIYSRMLEEFWPIENPPITSKDGMDELQNMFIGEAASDESGLFIVVLDEIDYLLTKDHEVLYKIFEWSMGSTSKLILIGIANALDLTDRFLPRLKARNLKPELLPFQPYSAPQIASVITNRLKSLLPADAADQSYTPYIHPAAVQLCARKVAAHTGDLRKAFDMCRRALELLDTELKEKYRKKVIEAEISGLGSAGFTPLANNFARMPLGESKINCIADRHEKRSSSPGPATPNLRAPLPSHTYDVVTGPRVTIAHVARISSAVFGGSAVSRVKHLNLQQKAVLCACCVSETRNNTAPSMRELYGFYTKLCKRDRLLAALSNSEFRDVVGGLESAGVVGLSVVGGVGGVAGTKTPSKRGRGVVDGGIDERKVSCLVREPELRDAVKDVGPILTAIFHDP